MLPEYVVVKACPRNRVTRWAEDKVRRALNMPLSVTLPAKYKQWLVLNDKPDVDKAGGEPCFFAYQAHSKVRHYLAKSDVGDTSKTVKRKASLW